MNQHFKHKASTWPPSSPADRHYTHSDDLMVRSKDKESDGWVTGYVERYDHTRGYGFVISDVTGEQNFLPRIEVIRAYRKAHPDMTAVPNFIDLPKNHRVSFASKPTTRSSGGRDEVVEIKFIDPIRK
jgi:hypothetical protein